MNISSSSTYSVGGSSSNKGISGLASGLNTDEWVEQMLAGTQGKIDKQEGLKQQLTWKQDMYRDVISSINSLKSKYFDSAFDSELSSNLASANFFNSMLSKVTNGSEFLDIISTSSSASVGDMSVVVKNLATSAKLNVESNKLSKNEVSGSLADVSKNFQYKYATFKVDDGSGSSATNPKEITLDLAGVGSDKDLTTKLNETFAQAGIDATARIEDGRLNIATSNKGTSIALTGGSEWGFKVLGFDKEQWEDVVKNGNTIKSSAPDGLDTQVFKGNNMPAPTTGVSFNVTLNGVTKSITVDPKMKLDSTGKPDPSQALSSQEVKDAMAQSIMEAFGGKLTYDGGTPRNITGVEDGYISLEFSTTDDSFTLKTANTSDQFTVTGINASAVGIKPGSSSRISTSTKLKDLDYKGVVGGTFSFKINGKTFSFSENDSLGTMMNAINNGGAGVRMAYSSLSDTFTLEATNTGSKFGIEIEQTRGNVLSQIFNTAANTVIHEAPSAASHVLTTTSIQGVDTYDSAAKMQSVTFKVRVNNVSYNLSLPTMTDDQGKVVPYSTAEAIFGINNEIQKNEELLYTDASGDKKPMISLVRDSNGSISLQIANDAVVEFDQTNVSLTDTEAVANAKKSDLAFALGFTTTAKNNIATKDTEVGALSTKSKTVLDAAAVGSTSTIATVGDLNATSSTTGFSFENGRLIAQGYPPDPNTGIGGISAADVSDKIKNNADLNAIFGGNVTLDTGEMDKDKISKGEDALVSINGEDIIRSSNTFTIDGVTMALKKEMPVQSGILSNTLLPKTAGATVTGTTTIGDLDSNQQTALLKILGQSFPTTTMLQDINSNGIYYQEGHIVATQDAAAAINSDPGLISFFGGKLNTDQLGSLLTDPANINTVRDTDIIVEAIKTFVDDYNKMVTKLNDFTHADANYRKYSPLTDAQKKEMSEKEIEKWEEKAQEGLLRSDSNINMFLSEMRLALYTKPSTSKFALYDIGIESTDNVGQLSFNETSLRNAIASDPDSVRNLFTDSETGLSSQMIKIMDSAAKLSAADPGTLVQEAGMKGWASATNNNISKQLTEIESKIKDLKKKYEKERQRYWNQFNSMESVLSNFNSQSSWLAQQFGG